ncbi:hypothetical protein [Planctomycetes bacterium K23_9]|uniref:SMI1 / KNR4 family protein n=1 Tax=Stieleria marina TaxID=1930275 RepID=A0A517NU03_9BACT|nr:hypothetical protein K239x_25660 [Planctomycetes bacterium K23_9]
MGDDAALIRRFVDCFLRLDDSSYTADAPPPATLSLGQDPDDWNTIRWAPAAIESPPESLGDLPSNESLPALYRQLVLSFRWLSVDLHIVRLLGNPPGDGLEPLANQMTSDPVIQNTLGPKGYVRFALAPDCYDPICFDLNRVANDDCPIVRLSHEPILMRDKIGDVSTVFNTFRDLVYAVLALEHQT